ncbi:MAG: aminoacetone oxidase family FAD-binding enzyme [Eubacterium sp.]|nr:aminoacetone oxidase family FAD-binding enzyme [Eubacterium sp.]MDE6155477.1 aminoacetone oxidase family FAD-binding enzyme [Eubacterium sp.]
MTTIIIGAGAGGLACAIRLKQNNPDCKVQLLERMPSAGKKILATGNGRCNLSNINAEHCDIVIDFFKSIGLVTRTDEEGRIYPYSNQAATVVELLLNECSRLGIEIITDCTVSEISRNLNITTNKGQFKADNVVIATGGKAQKNLGSDGSGYKLLQSLGHSITPLAPALVQLTSSSKYPRKLKGHRVKCNISILLDGETIKSEYGEVLFADYGLSGIVTMNLSDIVSKNFSGSQPKKCHTVLDLIPDISQNEVSEYLNKFGNLSGILGSELSSIIEKQAEGNPAKAAMLAKSWKLIITGTKGFDFAQITSGGAKLDEFNEFQSKKIKDLYACGEVLDKQFMCGGYNLNFAWYSGIKVADKITIYNKV